MPRPMLLTGSGSRPVDGARVTNTRAYGNAGYGICVDYNDATLRQAVRLATVTGKLLLGESPRDRNRELLNATNQQPPTWGKRKP